MPLGLKAHAHDAVKGKSQEADQRMGADAIWQPMVDGRDLDICFQCAKPTLNIAKFLVLMDSFFRRYLGNIGQQDQFAVEQRGLRDGVLIHCPAEALCLKVRLDEAGREGVRTSRRSLW